MSDLQGAEFGVFQGEFERTIQQYKSRDNKDKVKIIKKEKQAKMIAKIKLLDGLKKKQRHRKFKRYA